jgi:hypothetical protein
MLKVKKLVFGKTIHIYLQYGRIAGKVPIFGGVGPLGLFCPCPDELLTVLSSNVIFGWSMLRIVCKNALMS